jgi:hypothetical protein
LALFGTTSPAFLSGIPPLHALYFIVRDRTMRPAQVDCNGF